MAWLLSTSLSNLTDLLRMGDKTGLQNLFVSMKLFLFQSYIYKRSKRK